ncbi:YoaK family protein [Devosia rhodophyticola]|uniref:YoaK family protein n=1 Tax=Devosia rhodophyticola TaxID=3026423 RepID=A0ABY7YWJ2_9HYPH|nr:YoaK family protein [Devosia rhodophyticola]WDR05699.1 YoaK family protein [Devosia rhodophyticola]
MTPISKLSVGLLLTLAAGYTDAIGFVELGGFFTSFMSGNTTQLGIELTTGTLGNIATLAALILFFFAGGLTGSLLAHWNSRWTNVAVTALTAGYLAVTLVLIGLGVPAAQALLFLAASAGAQNAILRPVGSARLGTTFVTGTLFMASQELARTLIEKTASRVWIQHLAIWGALLIGAVWGAIIHARFGIYALLVPLIIYLGLGVRSFWVAVQARS